jgi:PhzF family phenazine biosynthesis protein
MNYSIYQVDAFAEARFAGNPAAVVPLASWLDDAVMQRIAAENNLSETAFFVKEGDAYSIRWFTPSTEVKLCGHATLATAHVLFEHLGYKGEVVTFKSKSGELAVSHVDGLLELNFPADAPQKVESPMGLAEAMGLEPEEVYKGESDYMLVYSSQQQVESLSPIFYALKQVDARGIIATAKGNDVDFVSRFFAPQSGINEDPVTGSAHTTLTPYWAAQLGKDQCTAKQVSKRGGELLCTMAGDRVRIAGKAVTYLEGSFKL